MGKAKKGTAATASVTPKCTCDHPFQCDCGNRPERPSKGHKWYPTDQIWAGKGHKQKGASGQVSSISEQAKVTEKGQTKVSQWQRLPSQLLDEACKQQGRLGPKYRSLGGNGQYKFLVILPDVKDRVKDLLFQSAQHVSNEEQAKEEGALLALLRLTPTLPHERKLPEPYKTTWLNAISSLKPKPKKEVTNESCDVKVSAAGVNKPAVTMAATASTRLVSASSYTSQAEKRQHMEDRRKLQNARIRKHEAIRMANQNHPVFMSAAMRRQTELLLRGTNDGVNMELQADTESVTTDDDENYVTDGNDVQLYVVHRLHSEGFAIRQARAAWQALSSTSKESAECTEDETVWEQLYEECLQWLLVFLNEDQLPEGFDPRGRTLDVVAPVSKAAFQESAMGAGTSKSNGDSTSIDAAIIETTSQYGVSVREASLLTSLAVKKKASFVDTFWQTIQIAAGLSTQDVVGNMNGTTMDRQEMVQEENEALLAIFDSGCSITTDDVNHLSTVSIALEGGSMSLQVLVRNGAYPSMYPICVVVTGQWPSPTGVDVHVALAKFVHELPLDEPMIFAIHAYAQDLIVESDQNNQRSKISLIPYLMDTSDQVSPQHILVGNDEISHGDVRKNDVSAGKLGSVTQLPHQTRKSRPRETRRTFWSIRPRDAPTAVAFPKVGYIMEQTRKSLPAANSRSEFLSAMKKAKDQGIRVVLVTGETGSGKTTQLPAYLLEDNPDGAKIVVVQPRRLAATGVANRVAEERGEARAGIDSIGYVVRGDSAICNRSRLIFCTTGVLLRQLQQEGALDCLTTIIVDEVHERNLDGDVLLGLLKQQLPLYPHLHVVLMSATLETERFSNYWGSSPVPHVHIPGRTFPVKDFLLEDVLQLTRYIPSRKKKKAKYASHRQRRSTPWNDSEMSDDDDKVEDTSDDGVEESIDEAPQHSIPISDLVKRMDETTPDFDLICRLVTHIITNKKPGDDGSILVFLAGAPEINRLLETIKRELKDLPIAPLPLHGGLQPKEQNRVFQPAQRGFTKLVLSTNVAETSVTIADTTVVIDTCREKQASYDPVNRMPQLIEQFASKAALKQRRGRAGRVREGTCFKLISKCTYDALRDHSEPEIRRVALDQTLLQLIFLGVEKGPGNFTNTLLDPPSQESLQAATSCLRKLGALESSGVQGELCLTPLGEHLAGIPAPPMVGKMLVMGSILGCREAALAMAAGISVGRSPFLRMDIPRERSNLLKLGSGVLDDENKQQQVLKQRAILMKEIGNSDHALLAAVFLKWKAVESREQHSFCSEFGLSSNVMHDIAQLFKQLDSALVAAGFSSTTLSGINQTSLRIIHTCAVAAMAPSQIVKVRRPATKYLETAEGAREKGGEAKELSFFVRTGETKDELSGRAKEERVFIHPSSMNFHNGNYSFPFLVYHSMVRTSKPFLRDVTECSAYALLLFGGELEIKASKGVVFVDGWAELAANARIGSLMGGLRRRMDALLTEKVKDPSIDISSSDVMKVIVKLIMTDGLGS